MRGHGSSRRRGAPRGALVAGLLLPLALAACGGDDGGGTDTTAGAEAPTEAPATAATTPADDGGATTAPAAEDEATTTGAPAEGGDKPLIYVIYKQGTQQYFVDQADGAKGMAEELGADIKVVNVESDGNLAITSVQDAIAAGAQGIGITVPDQSIGPRVAELAAAAGIPLVATDDSIKDDAGGDVAFVGFDGTEMGKKTGEAAAQLLDEAGWVADGKDVGVLSVEKQDLSVCNDRTDAQKAALEAAGLTADQIFAVAGDNSIDGAQNAAGPVITAHGDVTNWIVTGCNDESVKGALNALNTAGVNADDVIGVGLGAYEACKDWQAGTPSGFKAALFINGKDVGEAAVTALYDNIVKDTPLPPKTVAKTTIVGPDDWEAAGLVCS